MDAAVTEPRVERTEHPHIVRVAGVAGGRPTLAGSRITVAEIASLYKAGETADEIVQLYPHLNAAAIFDAISFYLDHQQAIEQEISANRLQALTADLARQPDERGFVRFTCSDDEWRT